MHISVIICSWNRAESLRSTLRSLLALEMPPSAGVEVLVVDNNSRDQTRRVVDAARRDAGPFEVRYLFEPRQGKQFALNRGIRHAAGDILAFTDDDVWLDHGWLTGIAAAFEKGEADVVGGITRAVGVERPPAWYSPSMSAVIAEVDLGDQPLAVPPADYAPSGTNLIVTREVARLSGGFSERHYRHMDYEFGLRVRRQGFRVRYDPRLMVFTRVPAGVMRKQYFRRWYFKQGIAASLDAAAGGRTLLLAPRWMWKQIAEEAGRWAACTLRGRRADAFAREMRVAHLAGFIASRWHLKLRPASHPRWSARWSQKTGERFA